PLGSTPTALALRLQLRRKLPLRYADRILLRDPGSKVVYGATVRDPDPLPLRRRGAAARRGAALIAATSPAAMSELIVAEHEVLSGRWLRRAGLPEAGVGIGLSGDRLLVDPHRWERWCRELPEAVLSYRRAHPLLPGPSVAELVGLLGVPEPSVPALVSATAHALADGRVVPYREPTRESALPARVGAAVDQVARALAKAPFRAPEAHRLAELGLGRAELAAAERAGRLLRIAEGVVLLPDAVAAASAVLTGLDAPFTLSQARRALDTSRRVAVPLMELLDARRVTRRLADDRRELRG
ncbi:MAG: SelB C-terminal domain-containing protein, partial [Sciscionella sp.]